MRRFLIIAIPIVTLLLFFIIMISGNILKKPLGKDDNIPRSIHDIIDAVDNEAWDEADGKLRGLEGAWEKVVFRAQFGSEREEIKNITTSIARLKGAIKAEDKAGALMESYEAFNHWLELGN
ncbi:MAG: DUF4363 family protein [Herbinix sp.]|nr:DUF4363 family protein [Herbinix sp.]